MTDLAKSIAEAKCLGSLVAIDTAHKAVILAQWQWLQEPVKLPGSYMQERELSNAWNRIVMASR